MRVNRFLHHLLSVKCKGAELVQVLAGLLLHPRIHNLEGIIFKIGQKSVKQ